MNPTEVRQLLNELCTDLGFCLPPLAKSQLEQTSPEDAVTFARSVFSAEGMNPDLADRHLFRQVRTRIAEAIGRSSIKHELNDYRRVRELELLKRHATELNAEGNESAGYQTADHTE